MRHALLTLRRNLAAGARLALFRPVGITSFRITLATALGLLAFGYALDIVLDALRVGAAATFNVLALPRLMFSTVVMLLFAALLAIGFRQPHLMLAVVVVLVAAQPMVSIASTAYRVWVESGLKWTPALSWTAWGLWFVLLAWGAAILARTLALALSPRPRHFRWAVVGSALAMAGAGYLVETAFPQRDWWYAARERTDRQAAWRVVTEEALTRQPRLLEETLQALQAQRPGVVDLYFVGFAPYAGQDVFRRDVDIARAVVDDRYDLDKRSVVLVNHPQTVLQLPLATGSNLRATLKAIGQRIDPDEDVVMLFLTSHGSVDHRLSVEFAPLQLDQIGPANLRAMLDEAGIRFRVVVISACYSGGFISALADDRTLVMTAAAADRTSFGCSTDSPLTFFTDALFNQALRADPSLPRAFARAHILVTERERAEGLSPPSDPQISAGAAIGDKLDALEKRAAVAPTTSCAARAC